MRRRANWLVGGLVLLGLGLGILGPYAWSRYDLRVAEQALGRYDFRTAHQHLEQSLARWSGNAHALLLAVQTARRLDDCAQAERRLTDYEQRYGATEDGRLEWLLLGAQQGDLAVHDSYLESLVHANHPAQALILEALAKGYMNVARRNRMLSCLDLLLKTEPTNTPALVLHGKGWEGLHDPERALEDYQHAVELDPACDEARLQLAQTLQRLGHVREAIAHYELLRQRQPGNPAALLGLARCCFDSHELERATELLDALLAANPDHLDALLDGGRLALCRGQLPEAEKSLSRATALAPWQREAHRLLHGCLQALGKTSEAEKCQNHLRELEASDRQAGRLSLRYRNAPRDASVRFELATWALQNGREQEGRRWLFAALLVDPKHGAAHAALADYFERVGQPKRGAEHRRQSGTHTNPTH